MLTAVSRRRSPSDASGILDSDLAHNLGGLGLADAVNVLKRDHDALVRRDVYAGDTGHVGCSPGHAKMRERRPDRVKRPERPSRVSRKRPVYGIDPSTSMASAPFFDVQDQDGRGSRRMTPGRPLESGYARQPSAKSWPTMERDKGLSPQGNGHGAHECARWSLSDSRRPGLGA